MTYRIWPPKKRSLSTGSANLALMAGVSHPAAEDDDDCGVATSDAKRYILDTYDARNSSEEASFGYGR